MLKCYLALVLKCSKKAQSPKRQIHYCALETLSCHPLSLTYSTDTTSELSRTHDKADIYVVAKMGKTELGLYSSTNIYYRSKFYLSCNTA